MPSGVGQSTLCVFLQCWAGLKPLSRHRWVKSQVFYAALASCLSFLPVGVCARSWREDPARPPAQDCLSAVVQFRGQTDAGATAQRVDRGPAGAGAGCPTTRSVLGLLGVRPVLACTPPGCRCSLEQPSSVLSAAGGQPVAGVNS